jgi:hypothetical protein
MLPVDGFVLGPEQIRQSRRLAGGKAVGPLEFSWQEVPGANSYNFTLLAETPRGLRPILSVEGSQNSYAIEDIRLLERGSFVWRVEAQSRAGGRVERRGAAAESRFTVDVPAPGNPRVRDPGVLYGQ